MSPTGTATTSTYCLGGAHDRCPIGYRCSCNCHRKGKAMPRDTAGSSMHRPREAPPDPADQRVDFAWEEPPPRGGRASTLLADLTPHLDQLRTKPGEWARLMKFPKPLGANSAKTTLGKNGPPGFEFAARKVATGSALYGRFTNGKK